MNESRVQNMLLSVGLLAGIVTLIVVTLVYQVSAVVLAGQREMDRWVKDIEHEYGYSDCRVLDDSRRIIRILTLQCLNGTPQYIHIAEGGTLLGQSEVNAFDLEVSQRWVDASYGDNVITSISFYQGKTVLRIHNASLEVLVDPITLSELWKVDLNYE